MIPEVLVLAGLVLLAAGWLLLRSFGAGGRIGRILAATPVVPISRARGLAESGAVRYVAVSGRIDAELEFVDEHQRPLVLRRTRLEARSGSRWNALEDAREAVAFELVEGLDRIAVDEAELDEGLVVVSRESEGVAGDVPDRMPSGTAPGTLVRLRMEIVSSVDHALALGVPALDPVRGPILRPGLGRPLILTTLERPEALRLLASGRRRTTMAISGLLGGGVVALVLGVAWWLLDAVG